MKVLIIGRGVVGSIYGWALSSAGIDVTHVVRRAAASAPQPLDLLDLRPGHPRHARAAYAPHTVTQVSPDDAYDLVIVATKHYQAAQAVEQYRESVPNATILMFTANWDGTEAIDRLVPRARLLWGYAKATGGVDPSGVLVATVDPMVRLGMLEGSGADRFAAVGALFGKAGIGLDAKPNIVEWLWVHHAINAGGIGACLWAGGIAQATRSPGAMRLGVRAVREALAVVAARGVSLEDHPDAKGVLHTPAWLAALAAVSGVRLTEKGRRLLRASHFANSAEEMKRFYFDVLETAVARGVAVPVLASLRERIERYSSI